MRVLVVTIVHTPKDARIFARQIRALREAGHHVTYAAPWTARSVEPPSEIETRDLPRASGRSRAGAVRAARDLLARDGSRHDIVLLHDPDLLLSLRGRRPDVPIVWDVHEDTSAALVDRDWVPAAGRGVLQAMVRRAERWAERELHLLLAEDRYQERFERQHPVVHNYPIVPDEVPPSDARVATYVGRLAWSRGLAELIGTGEALGDMARVQLVGWVDANADEAVREAADRGGIDWTGGAYVPNEQALAMLEGSAAGLNLLHDQPNYRVSLPTKVIEYMARGVPVVTTPLPLAVDLVERHDCGIVVPFGDAEAAADAVRRLVDDPELRHRLAANGHAAALEHYDWRVEGKRFVRQLEEWAR